MYLLVITLKRQMVNLKLFHGPIVLKRQIFMVIIAHIVLLKKILISRVIKQLEKKYAKMVGKVKIVQKSLKM